MAETWYGEPVKEKRPGHHVPMPLGPLNGAKIRLERESCYGFCPVYSVELTGDGRVVYEGSGHVLIHGRLTYKIDAAAIQTLLDQARAADFWSLDEAYKGKVTDNANVRISVTIGGRTKTVLDYVGRAAGMPADVSRLESAVDKAAGTARWVEGDESTLADLSSLGWDFHATAAGQALATAAERAPEAIVLGLIAAGAPLADVRPAGDWPANNTNPLQNACRTRRYTIVRALVDAGALDVTLADPDVVACTARMK